MFVCEKCRAREGVYHPFSTPSGPLFGASHGMCELCLQGAPCYDINAHEFYSKKKESK